MKIIILIILLTSIFSCSTNKDKLSKTQTENWKLSWRMFDSYYNENYQLAERQFDSLLVDKLEIKPDFIIIGLEILQKLGKDDKLLKILNSQDANLLYDICNSNFMNDKLRENSKCKSVQKEVVENPSLQIEIIKMYINDQYSRKNLLDKILTKYNLNKEEVILDYYAIDIDERNEKRLKEIIEEFGFPTIKMIGKDAMKGVFYIIQHSRDWQESQLNNVKNAVKNGDLTKQNYAYLFDRIKIHKGEKQLYGTQIKNVDKNNIVELFEVEDEENLNTRRMEMGIMPIELYKKLTLSM